MRAFVLAVALFPTIAAAQQGGGKDGTSVFELPQATVLPDDPQDLYELGLRQLKRASYDEAILSFERVRSHFPFNNYSVLAELRVADCLFEKGSFVEAGDAYREWVRLHPRHPEVDYAEFRSARSELKLAPLAAQRDQAHTRRALDKLVAFEARFPESRYLEEARRHRSKAEDRLAAGAVQIANFYWKQKHWKAAERRYRLATELFPRSARAEKARFRRALCLAQLGQGAEARLVLQSLVSERPDSPWSRRAQQWLNANGVEPLAPPLPTPTTS